MAAARGVVSCWSSALGAVVSMVNLVPGRQAGAGRRALSLSGSTLGAVFLTA